MVSRIHHHHFLASPPRNSPFTDKGEFLGVLWDVMTSCIPGLQTDLLLPGLAVEPSMWDRDVDIARELNTKNSEGRGFKRRQKTWIF